jgi:C4-dicarboxylate transporter DctQ subunit
MCFRFLQVMWAYYWTGELPHHDQAHVEGLETSKTAPIALGEA